MAESQFPLKCKDSGIPVQKAPGLSPAFIPARAANRKYCDTGPGSTISRQIEELFDDLIWAEDAPGRKPTCYFTIETLALSAPGSKGGAGKAGALETGNGESKRDGETASSFNILVAEDNHINQKLILRVLEKMGFKVHLVENGVQVLEALEKKHYDLILMDIQMPEMDGEEATKRIFEKYGDSKRPRIVAVTANALPGDREKYLGIGMDDYISKPINIARFRERITHWTSTGKEK